MHELLQTVNRSQSECFPFFLLLPILFRYILSEFPKRCTGPLEDDRLSVKRELENQDGVNAQRMFKVLDAVNRGQSQ